MLQNIPLIDEFHIKRYNISKLEFSHAFSLRGVKVAPFGQPPTVNCGIFKMSYTYCPFET